MSDSLNLFGKQRASLIADTITYPDIVLCSYISFQTVQRIKLFFFCLFRIFCLNPIAILSVLIYILICIFFYT